MANEKNLVAPFTSDQSRIEASKNGRKGGINSGIARRKKKTLKELALMFGSMKLQDEKMIKTLKKNGIDPDDFTNDMAMIFGLTRKAQSGDPQATKLLTELRGEYSTRLEVEPVQPKPLIDLTEDKK